ncbi:hypothetical protein [Candidatus Aalborgicola defluviihabitans]|uniref:hypothetical protein n=1 Tax=Candidatus Aalborgicola defluviihabitans TaxID=3386187 RepID=UPI00390AB853|nr:hypothetical protein [Burkholderiales bacterium]
MKYYLVILYLTNPCGDAANTKIREYASYFECSKQSEAETKAKDSRYPFKRAYCVGSVS